MDLKRYEIFTAVSFSEIDLLCYRCLNSETTMNPTHSYTPPPDPLQSPSLRRSSIERATCDGRATKRTARSYPRCEDESIASRSPKPAWPPH